MKKSLENLSQQNKYQFLYRNSTKKSKNNNNKEIKNKNRGWEANLRRTKPIAEWKNQRRRK